MPHQLLLNADWGPGGIKPRPVGVAERVPADSFQPELSPGRTYVVLLDGGRMEASIGDVGGEDSVAGRIPALFLPPPQQASRFQVQRNVIFRALGLHQSHATVHRLHLDGHGEPIEIDSAPSQG
jgi:hypothetical protein